MKSWGITLLILGIGAFILPSMGLQFSLISIFGDGNEPIAGGVFAILGMGLFVAGLRQERQG